MGQPAPPMDGVAGGHEHPHDHPHDHPDLRAAIDAMRSSHEASMSNLRTDVMAARDVEAANAAANAAAASAADAEANAAAAVMAAQIAEDDTEADGLEGETEETEIDEDAALKPPPAPLSHTPPAPAKRPGMWDKYPAHKST